MVRFSAKYGAVLTFSLQELEAKTSSVAMETNECFYALSELLHHGLSVKVFGTDCSISVAHERVFPKHIA